MSDTSFSVSRRGLLAGAAGAALAPALSKTFIGEAQAAAPMLGASRPTHYRFKLGAFEVTTIYDGALAIPQVHPIFGKNQKIEDVKAYLAENRLPGDRMTISFTPVIVNTGKEVVMFDTGYGEEARKRGAGQVAATLATAGFKPEQIDVVVITHCHPDHVAGLREGEKTVYPNARYVTGDVEYNFWSKKEHLESADKNMARRAKAVLGNVVPLAEKFTFIKPGTDVVTGVTAVEAFGHTPGHMCYNIESGGKRLRHGRGQGRDRAQEGPRHDRHRQDRGRGLPHALPGRRLRRQEGRRLPLGPGDLPARPLARGGRTAMPPFPAGEGGQSRPDPRDPPPYSGHSRESGTVESRFKCNVFCTDYRIRHRGIDGRHQGRRSVEPLTVPSSRMIGTRKPGSEIRCRTS